MSVNGGTTDMGYSGSEVSRQVSMAGSTACGKMPSVEGIGICSGVFTGFPDLHV